MPLALLVFFTASIAGAAAPSGTIVTLMRDGATVSDGEVCRFRAGDRENPFKRWLASQEVTCVASGSAIGFPSGDWNVFGRAGGGVTASVLVDGAAAPETLSLSLAPAATLAPALPDRHSAVVYAPRRGSAYPVGEGTRRVNVPAGEELWLIVLERSLPVALVPILPLDAGSERSVDARAGGGSFIIGWLQVPEADRETMSNARGISLPHVRVTAGGPADDSYPLPPLELLHGAFVLLRAGRAGEAEVDVGGRGWLFFRRRVNVERAITVAGEPLIARAAATLIINWSSAGDLPALDRLLGTCDGGEKDRAAHFEISISSCPAPRRPNEPVDPASCQPVRKETFGPELTFGSVTLDDLAPGNYRAEMRFGKLPPVSAMAQAAALQQKTVRLSASFIEVYGSVTHGGEPLGKDASIQFRGGGVGFATGETNEYRAVVLRPIGMDEQIDVATCDGRVKAFVLSDRPFRRNARFDIDIPDNRLTVTVTDTFTRMPLGGATVRYVVMSRLVPRRPVVTTVLMTGDGESRRASDDAPGGRVVIKAVPEREIRLYVSRPGYQKYDVEPFSMLKSENKAVDVQLVPLRGSSGRIISPLPFESGAVTWFTTMGTETERADLAPDGTFIYARAHAPDETMIVVSRSHPLWALRTPAAGRGQKLEIRFPDAPSREFDVAIRGGHRRTGTHIGLVIGGVLVPQTGLRQHQALRDLPSILPVNGPLRIRDIAETGPIDVILGPTVDEVPGRTSGIDPLLLRQFAGAPHKRLPPGAPAIVFEVE